MRPPYEPGQLVAFTNTSPWYAKGIHFAEVLTVGYKYVTVLVPSKPRSNRPTPWRPVRVAPIHLVAVPR